jgi:hypothetical protein
LFIFGDVVFVSGDVVALGGVGLGDGVVCAYAMVAIAGIAAAAVRILNFIFDDLSIAFADDCGHFRTCWQTCRCNGSSVLQRRNRTSRPKVKASQVF